MQRLARIRAAIQAKVLAQYPELSADAIEPYCRLLCRKAVNFAGKDTDAIEADPEVTREQEFMRVTLTEEANALRDILPEVVEEIIEGLDPDAEDDDRYVKPVAIDVMETFINGGKGTPPLSLEAIRARVDTGTYLVSHWGERDKGYELPAYAYWQHRLMVWMLAGELEAPGLLNPFDPEHPECKAAFCQEVFPVEITALKVFVNVRLKRAVRRRLTEAQNTARLKALLDRLERQFVGDEPERPADWFTPQ
jgi:hypothetical protein